MFKRRVGGGVKGFLNNVQKNCTFLTGRLPLDTLCPINLFAELKLFHHIRVWQLNHLEIQNNNRRGTTRSFI